MVNYPCKSLEGPFQIEIGRIRIDAARFVDQTVMIFPHNEEVHMAKLK